MLAPLLLVMFGAPWASESALLAPDAPIPALIVTGENNHDWKYTTTRLRESLEETGRFTVDVTEKPAETLADAKALAKYRVLVLNYNGPRWGEPAESNFLKAVAGGVGVTVIHAANNSFIGWTEYEKLVGDLWISPVTSHGDYHAFDVHVVDREHPITHDLPDLVAHPDELYHHLVNTQGVERRVLMTAFSSPQKRGSGEEEPMVLVHMYGQGRVFHTPLGHVWPGSADTHVTWDDAHLRLDPRARTGWAATGAVTIPAALPNDSAFGAAGSSARSSTARRRRAGAASRRTPSRRRAGRSSTARCTRRSTAAAATSSRSTSSATSTCASSGRSRPARTAASCTAPASRPTLPT
jgi:type 1 glutamine amidotransferase